MGKVVGHNSIDIAIAIEICCGYRIAGSRFFAKGIADHEPTGTVVQKHLVLLGPMTSTGDERIQILITVDIDERHKRRAIGFQTEKHTRVFCERPVLRCGQISATESEGAKKRRELNGLELECHFHHWGWSHVSGLMARLECHHFPSEMHSFFDATCPPVVGHHEDSVLWQATRRSSPERSKVGTSAAHFSTASGHRDRNEHPTPSPAPLSTSPAS